MNLDKRIACISDIYSVNDGCHDWRFMNSSGYFANNITDFQDLSKCTYGEYTDYREQNKCFSCRAIINAVVEYDWFTYFIPERDLKPKEPEKKYRSYKNVQELFDDIGCCIGDVIHFRSKLKQTEYHALMTLYSTPKDEVETLSFGGFMHRYTMQELFDLFELHSRGEWKPFGIEE